MKHWWYCGCLDCLPPEGTLPAPQSLEGQDKARKERELHIAGDYEKACELGYLVDFYNPW